VPKSEEMKAGAGGYWTRFNEKFNPDVIKQINEASCVSAVGEMLAHRFGINSTQEKLLKELGNWSNSRDLARALSKLDSSKKWMGGHPQNVIEYTRFLLESCVPMCAIFRQGNPLGHAVLIEGLNEKGMVIVKDPFDQTEYEMKVEDVHQILSEVVFRST
jgi:ABC-type bacteriocin/lantibiotic exporter with double-glycine peptidase domain